MDIILVQIEFLRSARGGEGTDAVNEILGHKAFSHPKPPSLIRALVKQALDAHPLQVRSAQTIFKIIR